MDVETQAELARVVAATTTSASLQAELYSRGPLVAERRLAIRRWMRLAGADV
jgi:seryl-tRNA(Sec) selenium transferase